MFNPKQSSKLKSSLTVQIVGAAILFAVLPMLALGGYLKHAIATDLTKVGEETSGHSNESAKLLIDGLGSNLLDIELPNSHWGDFRTAIVDRDSAWIEENVNSILDTVPSLSFIATADLSGSVISLAGESEELMNRIEWPGIMERLQNEDSFYGLVNTSGGLVVAAVSKVTDDDGEAEPTGVLIFGRLLEAEDLEQVRNTIHTEVAVLTPSGAFIASSSTLEREPLEARLGAATGNPDFLLFERTSAASYDLGKVYASVAGIDRMPVGIIYTENQFIESAKVNRDLFAFSVITLLIGLVILLLIVLLLRRRIISPIEKLSALLRKMSEGSLTETVPDRYSKQNNALGILARSIAVMQANMKAVIAQTQSASEQLAATAEELAASSEEASAGSAEHAGIAKAVNDSYSAIAESAVVQQETVETLTFMTEEMDSSIASIASHADNASRSSAEMIAAAKEGERTINATLSLMNHINGLMSDLTQYSERIGHITVTISSITAQTNLLSLNASIEAARAGEHGQGFAIVAGEIRKLADGSKQAAEEIAGLIGGAQEKIAQSVAEVEAGTDSATMSRERFATILDSIGHTSGMIAEIAAASEQQAAQANELSGLAGSIAEHNGQQLSQVEEVRLRLQEMEAASREAALISEEGAAATQSLARLADQLRDIVSSFKV
ncbi:methyl-accepting chemotaxis protein [Paenibacillus sp. HB172176]|uniref:methyl-accepting chemotaxis protein n=1 Tax=Paenibacillus sp. HB172176 TaxID=2493690 RepID=UPI00143BA1E4|nr:methyl-accepting chemotaxis protein [Paenibacillus sp. HB172176]